MQLSIANKVIIILNYIANLLYYIRLIVFYYIIKLQLDKLLFIIERDKDNIFLVFFNTRIFFTLLLR
jgi:hypothetical protein